VLLLLLLLFLLLLARASPLLAATTPSRSARRVQGTPPTSACTQRVCVRLRCARVDRALGLSRGGACGDDRIMLERRGCGWFVGVAGVCASL